MRTIAAAFGSTAILLGLALLANGQSLSNSAVQAQCPWGRDARFLQLQASCLCSISPEEQALSVQCQFVNFTVLVGALQTYAQSSVIELLYVNNSSIGRLDDFVFKNLKIINLQISGAGINEVANNAFRGLENTLQNLNLAHNDLRYVPVEPLRQLRLVSLLDLSNNHIRQVPNNAFVTLRLKTLKLADNNVTLAENSLRGQEQSLKNLNLKGCQLKEVPVAIRRLNGLAYLDLGQNNIRNIDAGTFSELNSLSALNLERNLIQKLDPLVFEGVSDTLSSLSLLNNLQTEYPIEAIITLKELRVLDLGFNLLRVLPKSAFLGIDDLTLLALDGNPMATLPQEAFRHLNGTLRGLSLGSRFLTCDCNLRWITEWIDAYDLQVTSRERAPRFCGHPQHLRDKSFYQLSAQDLTCGRPPQLRPVTTTTTTTAPPPTTTRTTTPRPRPILTTTPPLLRPILPQGVTPTPAGSRKVFRPQVLGITPRSGPNQPTGAPVRPGDIITEIKMTVGQGDDPNKNRLSPKDNDPIRVPPPRVVSSEPGLLGGRPRGPAVPVLPPIRPSVTAGTAGGQIISRPREPPTRGGGPPQSSNPFQPKVVNKANLGIGAASRTPLREEGRPRGSPVVTSSTGYNVIGGSPSNNEQRGNLIRPKPPTPTPQKPRPKQNGQRTELALTPKESRKILEVPKEISKKKLVSQPIDVILTDAFKKDNSIILRWDSETSNILGFRVVYRLFGKPDFTHGPPLAPSEREFSIKNVPDNECIVVCVVSLEDVQISPGTVPFEQCREIRTEGVGKAQKLDWIIIPASAAIVATVIIAVIIFIACLKSSQKSRDGKVLDEKPIHTLSMSSMNGTLGPPGPPLAGLASLGLSPSGMAGQKEWDQLSMYSQRTERSQGVPRARMYHMERADLRQSRQSLVSSRHNIDRDDIGYNGRQSRASARSRTSRKDINRQSRRSRSRDRILNPGYISPHDNDSLNSEDEDPALEEDENWATSTDNNWTDYDQDIYMHRSTMKYGGHPPRGAGLGGGMFTSRDDVNL